MLKRGWIMIKLKACPKCHGDLYLQRDQYGRYMSCLQCGYLKELLGELLEETPEKLTAISITEPTRNSPAEVERLAA